MQCKGAVGVGAVGGTWGGGLAPHRSRVMPMTSLATSTSVTHRHRVREVSKTPDKRTLGRRQSKKPGSLSPHLDPTAGQALRDPLWHRESAQVTGRTPRGGLDSDPCKCWAVSAQHHGSCPALQAADGHPEPPARQEQVRGKDPSSDMACALTTGPLLVTGAAKVTSKDGKGRCPPFMFPFSPLGSQT